MSNERFSDQPLIVGGPTDQVQPSRDPAWVRSIDRVLAVQRPLIVAYIRSLRRRYPSATPEQLIRVLERRYLTAVTSGGAAVGATAVVPGIGTSVTLALSGVETAGFLESTAIFAQSVAEVHGIAVSDPERARALVMTLMLGKAGTDLLQQFTGQAFHNGPARKVYWGEMITSSMPQMVMGPVTDRLKRTFLKRFAVNQGTSFVGKALPFGIGAAIGGVGNHMMGRQVVQAARTNFGPPPVVVPLELEPIPLADGERKQGALARLTRKRSSGKHDD